MAGVEMAVDRERSVGEAAAVDDRGVIQLVGADEHVGVREGGEHSDVRGEAGAEEHRAFGVLPLRECGLQLGVHRA